MTDTITALTGSNTINQMMHNLNKVRTGITFDSNTAIRLPRGTNAQRPTAVAGAVRFNTTAGKVEVYDSTGWASIGASGLATTGGTMTGDLVLSGADVQLNLGANTAIKQGSANTIVLQTGKAAGMTTALTIDSAQDATFAADVEGATLSITGKGSIESRYSNTAQLANTNTYIATKSSLAQLGNTNTYIATKVATTTFNSALANTNAYTVRTTGSAQTMYPSLTVANTFVAQQGMPIRTVGGNTVTLALTDNGKLLMCTNGSSAMNIRIPNNSSVAFPVGSEISLVNVLTHASANSLGFVNTAGVTLSSKEASNTVADRYTSATLKKTGTNAWLLIGNLA